MAWHVGRSFSGTRLEDDCPCDKAPCGLAIADSAECPEHSISAMKTLRQGHDEKDCQGA